MIKESAVVVFSGGQDSTTCLFWAKSRFENVIAISFEYGQRHSNEIECAIKICKRYGFEHHVFDMSLLSQLAPCSLTRGEIAVDNVTIDGEVPNSAVDGRNMLFLTFVSVFAKQRGIRHIIAGVSESDFSGYPDCRDIFIKSLNVTLNLSMDYSFVVHTPLMWIDKEKTWELAFDLGVIDIIKNETLTCYNGITGKGCEMCPACNLRNKGLKLFEESKKNEKRL